MRAGLAAAWRTRSARIGTALVAIVAIALCFVPGFDVLNYYSSLALALVGALVAGVVGAADGRAGLADDPGRPRPIFLGAARAVLPLAVLPPAILLLNSLRVKNCDPLEGLAFYGMGPGLSMLFAGQIGAACALLVRRGRWATLLFVAVWLAWIARDVAFLYFEPPIFAYNPFAGFFSGAVYDDVIVIDGRFLAYRAFNLVQLGLVWQVAAMTWTPERGRVAPTLLSDAPRRAWIVLALLGVAWGAGYGLRGVVGYEIGEAHLRAALGGRLADERVVLHYDDTAIGRDEARKLLEDHRYRIDTLESALDTTHPEVVHSYVYGSPERKRALMGGARVAVAKPWLSQLHLNRVAYGASVVKHELAHVLLGPFADGPLGIPAVGGVLPKAALVEGAAEALEGQSGLLTHHQWSAALRRADLAVDLEAIMDPEGFWTQPAGKAYVLSGSFMTWLLDTRGPGPFKALYRGGDFEAAYGEPLPELLGSWRAFLDAMPLPDEAVALARQRYEREAIFQRTCPLEVARLAARAGELAEDDRWERSLELRRRILDFVPDHPRHRLALVFTLSHMGRAEEAAEQVERLASLDGVDDPTMVRVRELLADAWWRAGDTERARALYEEIVDAPQTEGRRRTVRVKLEVVGDWDREPILGPYLLAPEAPDAIDYLVEAVVDLPGDPLPLYLLGRRLLSEGHQEVAVQPLRTASRLLEHAGDVDMDEATITLVRRANERLLGVALYHAGLLGEARLALRRALELSPWEGRRESLRDWIARCDWREAGRRDL
ncbi:MAG: hypothetical protein ACQEXJ_00185 [Myxococcota bacterium]